MLRLLSGLGELRRLWVGCQGQCIGVGQSVWHPGNPMNPVGSLLMSDSPVQHSNSDLDNPIATSSAPSSHSFYCQAKYRKKSC